MEGTARIPHKEIEVKLEVAPASLTAIALSSGQAAASAGNPGLRLF
jgi:hypothetical protein